MVTKERFAQGMTLQQYLDQMGTNKERFVQFLNEITIRPEDKAALAKLGALYNVPVLAKMVEGNPNIEVRRALRAERSLEWRQGVVKEIRGLLKI